MTGRSLLNTTFPTENQKISPKNNQPKFQQLNALMRVEKIKKQEVFEKKKVIGA